MNLFTRAFENLIQAREAEAERFVKDYMVQSGLGAELNIIKDLDD